MDAIFLYSIFVIATCDESKYNLKSKNMKKLLLILIACISAMGTLSSKEVASDDPQLVHIVIKPNPSGNPRSQVPITATVDDETYMLEATFLTDIGMVDVLIQEQSSGASTYRCVDSADGTASISLPATSGYFVVTFTSEGGDIYEGTFVL